MSDFPRTAVLSLVCTLAACPRDAGPTDTPELGTTPIAEVEGGGAELAIVAVPQTPASETSQWLFEPGGRHLASTELGDCTVWDIETGRLIRSLELTDPPPPACANWLPGTTLSELQRDTSADGTLMVGNMSRGVEILASTGASLRTLPCPICETAQAVTWSASGHQIAFLSTEPLTLTILDADSGQHRSQVIAQRGVLEDFGLAWVLDGPLIVLSELGEPTDCNDYADNCDYDDNGEPLPRQPSMRRAVLDSGSGLVEIDLGIDQGYVDIDLDPEGQWMFWTHDQGERRSGTTSWLTFVGVGNRTSGLGWEHYEEYEDYSGSMDRTGEWRVDGATHWVVSIRYEAYEAGLEGLDWETTLTSPPLGRRMGEVIRLEDPLDSEVEAELFGFAGDALRFSGQLCMEEEACTPFGPVLPADCTILDIASGHGTELLDCGGRVHLRKSAGMTALPLDANATFWWWSRSGALALHDGDTFLVVDALTGRIGLQRTDVDGVLDGKLGTELDRLVLLGEFQRPGRAAPELGFEVLDLASLAITASQPDAAPMEVAFSPTGDRLAVLETDRIRVIELPSGKAVTSWEVQSIDQLAFRQDGKVVYVGTEMPEAGFDAATGQPVDDPLLFATITEAIENGGEPDPSWRWIMHDEFRELMRTIDGRTLEFRGDEARLPDTGQYSGSPPGPELAFRVGDNSWAVPEFDGKQLEEWLRRPDLVELFMTGQTIAKPTITTGELDGLRARVATETRKP